MLPRYPTVPVARIGRLAIDVSFHGQKLGGLLLFDAIARAAHSELGIDAVVVDAQDDAVARCREHHGFAAFESAPRVLFPMITETLKRLMP